MPRRERQRKLLIKRPHARKITGTRRCGHPENDGYLAYYQQLEKRFGRPVPVHFTPMVIGDTVWSRKPPLNANRSCVNDTVLLLRPFRQYFNIFIDIFSACSNIYSILEVFTSVPPDPVSIVHCRHWVVLFLCRATAPTDLILRAEKSVRQSCRAPRPRT